MSLEVCNLYKKYGEKVVVNDLSFEMKHSGIFALLGTNGAGKTTTIRMMLDMIAKDSGKVIWNGAPLNTLNNSVGYLAEERGLYPKYSIMDQLMYFARLKKVPKKNAEERIRYWSEKLNLDEYLYPLNIYNKNKKSKPMKAEQLSKGNQQKIQLMSALISDPDLLIFDEPISGLDPVNTDLFKSIIREQRDMGKYIIMSSHQMATIEEFCEDILILDRGHTVLKGNLNEIKKQYGRVNLTVKCDEDFSEEIRKFNLFVVEETPEITKIRVDNEEIVKMFLKSLIDAQKTIVKFELTEPSLHEIFIEKVGNTNEEN